MRKHLAGAILKYISIKQVFLRGESEIKKIFLVHFWSIVVDIVWFDGDWGSSIFVLLKREDFT